MADLVFTVTFPFVSNLSESPVEWAPHSCLSDLQLSASLTENLLFCSVNPTQLQLHAVENKFLHSCCVNQVCFTVKKSTQIIPVPIMVFQILWGSR